MTWQQIRQQYPNQWVLMEAWEARVEQGHRILDRLSVIESVDDGNEALRRYQKLHTEFPQREIVFYHTSHEQIEIEVRYWNGVRVKRFRLPSAIICCSSLRLSS